MKEQQGLLIEQKGNTDLSQHHFQKAPQQLSKSSETQGSFFFSLFLPPFPPVKWNGRKVLFFPLRVSSRSPKTELRAPYRFSHLIKPSTLGCILEGPVAASSVFPWAPPLSQAKQYYSPIYNHVENITSREAPRRIIPLFDSQAVQRGQAVLLKSMRQANYIPYWTSSPVLTGKVKLDPRRGN